LSTPILLHVASFGAPSVAMARVLEEVDNLFSPLFLVPPSISSYQLQWRAD
jgi:hypothetical protein